MCYELCVMCKCAADIDQYSQSSFSIQPASTYHRHPASDSFSVRSVIELLQTYFSVANTLFRTQRPAATIASGDGSDAV
jgi:hypothetical protein